MKIFLLITITLNSFLLFSSSIIDQHDKSGKIIKSIREKHYQRDILNDKSDTLKLTEFIEEIYNERGDIIEQKTILYITNKDSSVTRTTYSYNEKELLSEVNVFSGVSASNQSAALKINTSHTYNKAGLLKETVISDVTDNTLESMEYEYTDNGKKVIKTSFSAGKMLKSKTVDFFNDKGNKVKTCRYEGNQLKDSTILKYDSNNFEIYSANYSSEGQLEHKYVYENDSKGNRTRVKIYYNPETVLIHYSTSDYIFDSNGNWTEMTTRNYSNDKIISKGFREILYY